MAVLEPRLAILDEIDSRPGHRRPPGGRTRGERPATARPRPCCSSPTTSGCSSTSGRTGCTSWRRACIVRCGGPELADELERTGYAWAAGMGPEAEAPRERPGRRLGREPGEPIRGRARRSSSPDPRPGTAGRPGWPSSAPPARRRSAPTGLPTPRHEDWRFTSLAAAGRARLPARPGTAPPGRSERLASLPAPVGPRLVFENGRLRGDLSVAGALPPGAVVSSLAEALARSPELVRPHLGRLARPDGLAFTALNTALFEDGAFVYLPPGAVARAAHRARLRRRWRGPAGGRSTRACWSWPGRARRATLAEIYLGAADVYLTSAVTELRLGDGARSSSTCSSRTRATGRFHVSTVFAEQGAGARLSAHAQSPRGAALPLASCGPGWSARAGRSPPPACTWPTGAG